MSDLSIIQKLIGEDLKRVDSLILSQLESPVTLIKQVGRYILQSGGKRLRPLIALLSANCFAYSGEKHVILAAIVEFIHTATLLHDDVVDMSQTRRGKETANQIWGNQASVLVGDFLFSRSFQMMVQLDSLKVMALLAEASNTIAAGEVMQLMNCHNFDITESIYMETIAAKTAKLFSAAAELGAHIAGQPSVMEQAMAQYGMALGKAFQLIDDILDYTGDDQTFGKNIGDDLNEGKLTLPLIYVLQNGSAAEKALVTESIKPESRADLSEIQAIIVSSGAIDYSYDKAKQVLSEAANALNIIPDSPYKDALINLTRFVIERNY